MTRVFIIHGWDGYPGEGWQGWLAKELTSRGDKVYMPAMPNSEWPTIETWVPFLAKQVGQVDAQTAFVGHSIGCQTILRYLETLASGSHVGPVVMVAPWMTLNSDALNETKDSMAIAQPWLESPINWKKIKPMSGSWTALMSADDAWVPITDAEIFQEKLGAKIIRTDGRGHMSASEGVKDLPEALEIFDVAWT